MLNDENVILYLTLGDMSYKRQGYKECHRFAYINSRWKSSRVTHGTDQVAVKHKLTQELTLECVEWLAVCWIMKCVATLRSHLKQNLIYTLPFCNTWSVKDGQGSNSAHVSCWSKTQASLLWLPDSRWGRSLRSDVMMVIYVLLDHAPSGPILNRSATKFRDYFFFVRTVSIWKMSPVSGVKSHLLAFCAVLKKKKKRVTQWLMNEPTTFRLWDGYSTTWAMLQLLWFHKSLVSQKQTKKLDLKVVVLFLNPW